MRAPPVTRWGSASTGFAKYDMAPARRAMGAVDEKLVQAAANAPITSTQAAKGKLELARMRSSLQAWLRYRLINDEIAGGRAASVKTPLLKTPGATAPIPEVMALRLRGQRHADEAELAMQLHQLLSEVFDGASLPAPDIDRNPNAAVELAKIAIAGKLPGEIAIPDAAGFIWMWPLVVVIGVIAFVITSAIRSSADVAKEKEKIECIKAGKCTDTGFWLKLGAIAVVGWIVWDKMGVGVKVKAALGGRGARRNPSRRRRRSRRRNPFVVVRGGNRIRGYKTRREASFAGQMLGGSFSIEEGDR